MTPIRFALFQQVPFPQKIDDPSTFCANTGDAKLARKKNKSVRRTMFEDFTTTCLFLAPLA